MTTHSEREAFEVFVSKQDSSIDLARTVNDDYLYGDAHALWHTWLAARNTPSPRSVEGEAVATCGNCSAKLEVKPWKYGGRAVQCSKGCDGSYGLVSATSEAKPSAWIGKDELEWLAENDGHAPVYGDKNYEAEIPLYTHPAPSAVDGEMSEKDRIEFALRDAGFDLERAFAIAELATANSAEGKVVPEAVIIDAMEHLPNNRAATRHEMIRAFALALSATAREKMVVDEELTKDAARWRYLVAENNKGGLHGKYLICWYDPKGDGYCSTNGVSVNGKDDQAIVRIIDAAMLNATAKGNAP